MVNIRQIIITKEDHEQLENLFNIVHRIDKMPVL